MIRRDIRITIANRVLAIAVRARVRLMVTVLCCAGPASFALADSSIWGTPRNEIIENSRFIQISGPNPILTPGPEGAWDDGVTEASDAFRDVGTYYFYYHATGSGKGYRLALALADKPEGPWEKYEGNPLMVKGEPRIRLQPGRLQLRQVRAKSRCGAPGESKRRRFCRGPRYY